MPIIDLTKCNLTLEEMAIAKIAIKGNKEVGPLRASSIKERVKTIYIEPIYPDNRENRLNFKSLNCYANEEERINALGRYVWRELAFIMSPISAHHCMPVCNDFNLEYSYGDIRRSEQQKWLNSIVDKIYKTIPIEQLHGLNRWKNVLCY